MYASTSYAIEIQQQEAVIGQLPLNELFTLVTDMSCDYEICNCSSPLPGNYSHKSHCFTTINSQLIDATVPNKLLAVIKYASSLDLHV